VPDVLASVGAAILADLESFLREDFKGFPLHDRKYSLRDVASGAVVILRRLLPEAPPVRDEVRVKVSRGEEVVDDELSRRGGDAAFYDVVKGLPGV
jgi:hypothetical protein